MASSLPVSLGEWIKQMGYSYGGRKELSKKQLDILTSVQMRSGWRDIIKHVRPKQKVEMIRKNILLNELRNNKTSNSKINMALSSSNDLKKYLEMYSTGKEIEVSKRNEHHLKNTVDRTTLRYKNKKYKIEKKKEKINDVITKSEICCMKVKATEKKIEDLSETKDIMNLLIPVQNSSMENLNDSKTNISSCIHQIKNYITMMREKTSTDEDIKTNLEICNDIIMEHTFSKIPRTIFQVLIDLITSSNYDMNKKLVRASTKESEGTKLLYKGFENQFFGLCRVTNELHAQKLQARELLIEKTKQFEDVENQLAMAIIRALEISENDDESKNYVLKYLKSSSQIISLKENLIGLEENMNKVNHALKSTQAEGDEFNLFLQKFNNLNTELKHKCDIVKKYKNGITMHNDTFKLKVYDIKKSISETLNVHLNRTYDLPNTIFEENVTKEFELFMVAPLRAITRSWESDLKLDYNTKQHILDSPLSNILLRTDQNCLSYAYELLVWYDTLKKMESPKSINFNGDCKHFKEITDCNNDAKKALLEEIDKGECEEMCIESIVSFLLEQPLMYCIPEEMEVSGQIFSIWKERFVNSSDEINN